MRTDLISSSPSLRIALVGLGTIGKRLVDIVSHIPEFSVSGVAVRSISPALSPMVESGIPIYSSTNDCIFPAEIPCAGKLSDLLEKSDFVLDCTSRGNGAKLQQWYERANIRVIYQGGESSSLASVNYCSGIGFKEAISAPSVRVMSCNSTGLIRIAQALSRLGTVETIRAVLTRSATDPDKYMKGQPNAIISTFGESHHGQDIRVIWPNLNIITLASYAPVNCGHLVTLFAKLSEPISLDVAICTLEKIPRVRVIDGSGSLLELRRINKSSKRRDCSDVVIWRKGIHVIGNEVLLSAGIHMESIVIPETLDVLFAMSGLEKKIDQARHRTDLAIYNYL
ncbi:type II glyceraldehyde-3-phosphate dehydrogenase [Brenneria goodwinii]|nr:type II glyceraldehyde-3-phosphate dehydrogenase [Brenneria goodwinii]